MNLVSYPSNALRGDITVATDKSISHRAIILGAIAEGTTTIQGFLESEDCLATVNAFLSMGVNIEGPYQHQVIIHGVGKYGLKKPKQVLDCGNSGTCLRLLTGLLAGQIFDSQLTGDESLLRRPMLRISEPLMQMGAVINMHEGKAPLTILGNKTLKAIDYVMPQASAQVKSCLMLAALYAQGKTCIREQIPSRNHTESMFKAFSYPLQCENHVVYVDSLSQCKGTQIDIPGDLSSAAFFIVAACIISGSDLFIRSVGMNETRMGVVTVLEKMGAKIKVLNPRYYGLELVADLHIQSTPLQGVDIPSTLVPATIDEFPILCIAAACAKGRTTIHGAQELRCKESDRINAMVNGLTQLGIKAESKEDGLEIEGGIIQGGIVDSQGDHRVAMSFLIAGAMAKGPVTVKNCATIATSFPDFVHCANRIHCQIGTNYVG